MSAKSPVSGRQKQLAKTRALRAARLARREDMLEDVVGGVDRIVIARKHGVSLKTVYRDVNRALDHRRLDAPDHYVRVQVERLTRALQCIDGALLNGELEAVPHLIKVIDKLDRYHGLGLREPAEAPPRLEKPVPPLALTCERTENDA